MAGPTIIDTPKVAPMSPNALLLFLPCVMSDKYARATPLFHPVIPSIILEKRITRSGNIIPQIAILGKNKATTKVSRLSNVHNWLRIRSGFLPW
jgi:hypothetical protein